MAGELSDDLKTILSGSQGRQRKYRNRPTEIDGIRFDSQKESERYVVLRNLLRAGRIMDLEIHPSYRIEVGGVLICRYVADFAYHDPETYAETVEDVKSTATKTPVYRLKRKLMRAVHGIEIREV